MNRMLPIGHLPLALLTTVMLVRLLVLVIGIDSLADDPDSYARLAINWKDSSVLGFESPDGSVRPTAFRPPLYPWLLHWLSGNGQLPRPAVAGLHWLLGIATVGLTYSIGRQFDLKFPWLPALAVGMDPLLLRASQLVMTETLAAFLVVLAWRLWLGIWPPQNHAGRQALPSPWILLAFGLVLGLSLLARPTAAPVALISGVCLMFLGKVHLARRAVHVGLFGLGLAICVLPWTARNRQVMGKPIWATTHGGYTLLLANNPPLYEHFRIHGPSRGWEAEPFHRRWAARHAAASRVDALQPTERDYWFTDPSDVSVPERIPELEDDQLAYASALATIKRNPLLSVVSVFYRAGWFWAPWPHAGSLPTKCLIGMWYVAWYVLAIRGLASPSFRSAWRAWLFPMALVVSLTGIHAIYWGNMRMRAPLMSAIYVVATVGMLAPPSREPQASP